MIGFVSHPDCALHEMGAGHPECPQRLDAIQDQLVASRIDIALRTYEAPLASREQLCLAHSPAYVDSIFAAAPQEGRRWLDPDTSMNPHSLNAARRAAGAVIKAVDLVMTGEEQAAFCSVRPPGHHAGRSQAMGFCIFNNVAVGAAWARHAHAVQRLAIVDFDVHHGNGTEDIFAGDPAVLMCSTFQHPFYPWTGADSRAANMINVPLAAGSGGAAFRAAVETHWLPALHAFRPQLLLVSAGFDAHVEDDMAELSLVEQDYAWVTGAIKQIADRYAQGRVVSTLEGGYALSALGRSVAAHLNALLGPG